MSERSSNKRNLSLALNAGASLSIVLLPLLNISVFGAGRGISVIDIMNGFTKVNDAANVFGFNINPGDLMNQSGTFGLASLLIGLSVITIVVNLLMDIGNAKRGAASGWIAVALMGLSLVVFYMGISDLKENFVDLSNTLTLGMGFWIAMILSIINAIWNSGAAKTDIMGSDSIAVESTPLFCCNCGSKLNPGDLFCPECGMKL